MIYQEEEYLLLSGLQHFSFCRRQLALIHIEQQWKENLRTTEGMLFHERAHDSNQRERRGDTLILRGLHIASPTLGVSGQCDVVEFHLSSEGVTLPGEEGLWLPYPVEYKRGEPKSHDADRLQLCAQAICLEEMLCCGIPEGALFYGQTRRREVVMFTEKLRKQVHDSLEEMHRHYARSYTPKVRPGKSCSACSIKDLCLPALQRKGSASTYLQNAMEEVP